MKLLKLLVLCVIMLIIMIYPELGYEKQTVTVVMEPNETIWSIAEEYIDKQDKRMTMNEFLGNIEQENNKKMIWNTAKPGDKILIPLYVKEK